MEGAFETFSIPVIADGGSFAPDGLLEDRSHRPVKPAKIKKTQPAGFGLGVDSGGKEDFVGVDIADPGDHRLIEKKRLEPAAAVSETRGEVRKIEVKRLRAETAQLIDLILLGGFDQADKTELSDVRKTKLQAGATEDDAKTSIGIKRRISRADEKPARHLEMNKKAPSAGAIEKNHFAAPPQTENPFSGHFVEIPTSLRPNERRQKDSRLLDSESDQARPEATDDGLDFRKFWHRAILTKRPPGLNLP